MISILQGGTDLFADYLPACECGDPLTLTCRLESERFGIKPARCHGCIAAIFSGPLEDEELHRDWSDRSRKAARTVRERRLKAA